MSTLVKKGGFFSSISSSFSGFGNKTNSVVGHEGLEVVNPEEGQDDVEEEAGGGRLKKEEGESFWKMMQNFIGSDVTSMVTLPVKLFEPFSMLQKVAEMMEYSHLLDMADQCEDPHVKMVYASSWAVSVYYAYQRTWKPFNPILGETFEMVKDDGFIFLAEQVSHHPPVSSAHGENDYFTYDVTSKVKTKFLGNSLEVYPMGRTRVHLKKSNMTLDLFPPPTKVHNLIFGRTWIDSSGDLILTNLTTGDKAVLYFQPCGWFGRGRCEVDGYIYNKDEEPKFLMTGKWSNSMSYQPCDVEGVPIVGTDLKEVWRVADAPKDDKFQYTYYAHTINSLNSAPPGLLPSDSRLRPDRHALEMGDMSKASSEKSRLEERQRADRRLRDAKKQDFIPRWFKFSHITPTPWGDLETYEYNGKYTKHRQQVDSLHSSKRGDVDQLKSIHFNPWQFGSSEDQSVPHGSQVLPVSSENTSS